MEYQLKPAYADACFQIMIDEVLHVRSHFMIERSVYFHEVVKPVVDDIANTDLGVCPSVNAQINVFFADIPRNTKFRLSESDFEGAYKVDEIITTDQRLSQMNHFRLLVLKDNFIPVQE